MLCNFPLEHNHRTDEEYMHSLKKTTVYSVDRLVKTVLKRFKYKSVNKFYGCPAAKMFWRHPRFGAHPPPTFF
jgi:hypothetical protein